MPEDQQKPPSHAGRHFVINVLWSWLAVLFGLIAGVFLSPYVIHRLGDERYGIWALAFSFVDYFVIVDLGFKSAVVKYASHYRATCELDELDNLVSTALAYFVVAGGLVFCAAVALSCYVTRLFHVLPRDESAFRFLTITVGLGCALGVVINAFIAVLEAYQRFDISSCLLMVNNGIRAFGTFGVVYAGLGLKAMGLCILAGQLTWYALVFMSVRRLLPGRVFSIRRASMTMFKRMFGYGSRTLIANVSLMVANQGPSALIGHLLSATMAGYWAFPSRLVGYPMDLVGRLGMVTGSKAAELAAHGRTSEMSRLAVIVNRYCLMLFFVIPVYLTVFGRQLLHVWVNPTFAAASAPLLPILGTGLAVALAAQYNSSSILYGLGKHGSIARAAFIEAVLSVVCLSYVIPRYGLFGAACVVSGLLIVSRGIYVPYKVAFHLKINYWEYMAGIYVRPVAIMMPLAIIAWLANHSLGEPASWEVVLGAGAALSISYYLLVVFVGLEREHRHMIFSEIAVRTRKLMGWREVGALR